MGSFYEGLSKKWAAIPKPVKASFFAALIAGFVAHLPIIANRLYNHDSLTYLLTDPDSTFSVAQGKWLSLPVGLLLQGNIASTGIIVPVGILMLALTAAITVSVLRVQSPLWSAVIGAFTVLFPSVMSANAYYSTAIFFFALLLAALAVLVTVRYKAGFAVGILLLTLSCGIYSAFIGYAAGLFVIYAMIELMDNRREVRTILLSGAKYLAVLAASAILYYVVLQVVLKLTGVTLSNYRNIDQVGHVTPATLLASVLAAYHKVYYFFRYGIFIYLQNFHIEAMFRFLNWATLALLAILSVALIIRSGAVKKPVRIVLLAILAALLPIAIHAIAVLGQNAYTHWIMCYPFVLVYIFLAATADRFETVKTEPIKAEKTGKYACIASRTGMALVFAVSILLMRQWYFTANQGYEFLRYADQNAVSTATLLVDDIREAEGYSETVPVVFAGTAAPETFQYNTGDFSQVCGNNGDGYTGLRLPVSTMEHVKIILRDYIGVAPVYADDETTAALSALPEVLQMPVYPASGSIEMIDGCLVVKLSDIQLADPAE